MAFYYASLSGRILPKTQYQTIRIKEKEMGQVLHIHKMLSHESKVGRENNLSAGRKRMNTCKSLRNSNFFLNCHSLHHTVGLFSWIESAIFSGNGVCAMIGVCLTL